MSRYQKYNINVKLMKYVICHNFAKCPFFFLVVSTKIIQFDYVISVTNWYSNK